MSVEPQESGTDLGELFDRVGGWAGELTREVHYVLLLLALFVVPRVLQRYRIPRAITSLALGAAATFLFPALSTDETVQLFATFGIVALFLFAGLDVEVAELRRETKVLSQHLALGVALLFGTAWLLARTLDLGPRSSALVALALLTPSAGFILESLEGIGASGRERFWIRSKVIATELVALAVLFVALQAESWQRLVLSAAVLTAMIAGLPPLFRLFARLVAPYAPKSEFAFLLMVAVLCGIITKHLGVYYLVGAFVVGMAAQRFRKRLPAMASERMLDAVEAFASLFVPFYFFAAGLGLRRGDFQLEALALGLAFLAFAFPLRVASIAAHRRLMLGERWRAGWRVGVAMMPTLVFTLVVAQALREARFAVPPYLYGALVVYAILSTLIPTFILRLPPPEFDALQAPAVGYGRDTAESFDAGGQAGGTPQEPGQEGATAPAGAGSAAGELAETREARR
jgi:Kef-type K+ transport system membrane component KefB